MALAIAICAVLSFLSFIFGYEYSKGVYKPCERCNSNRTPRGVGALYWQCADSDGCHARRKS